MNEKVVESYYLFRLLFYSLQIYRQSTLKRSGFDLFLTHAYTVEHSPSSLLSQTTYLICELRIFPHEKALIKSTYFGIQCYMKYMFIIISYRYDMEYGVGRIYVSKCGTHFQGIWRPKDQYFLL